MKNWIPKACELLTASLAPPRNELNELDWKAAVSPDKKRLTEHLSAFANYPGGGFLVYGVKNDGVVCGVSENALESSLNQLANLGREALEPPLAIDHAVIDFEHEKILIVFVAESDVKPVHLRGKSMDEAFIRSGGTTRKASRQEIGSMMLNSRTPQWEDLRCTTLLNEDQAEVKLDVKPIFKMLNRPEPSTSIELRHWMEQEGFIECEPSAGCYITNLGAIATARQLTDFSSLSRKAVRVVVYDGLNKEIAKHEKEGGKGYAIGFQGLIAFVMAQLPHAEVIEQGLRRKQTMYPEIALREIMANALIHQDFSITGAGPLVEIFNDRVEISNPGGLLPSKRLDRLIGTQPESRNEKLARAFRRYNICEERGSGLLKAGLQIEQFGLPPIEFRANSNSFKVTLFAPKKFADMSVQERLDACYQHAVLKHFSAEAMTNTTLRNRLRMPEKQRSMVSALIQDAINKRLIKPADPENTSRKFAEYVPFWA